MSFRGDGGRMGYAKENMAYLDCDGRRRGKKHAKEKKGFGSVEIRGENSHP